MSSALMSLPFVSIVEVPVVEDFARDFALVKGTETPNQEDVEAFEVVQAFSSLASKSSSSLSALLKYLLAVRTDVRLP